MSATNTVAYADFVTITSDLGKRRATYFYSASGIFNIFSIGLLANDVVWVGLSTKPTTFDADFPNATQLVSNVGF